MNILIEDFGISWIKPPLSSPLQTLASCKQKIVVCMYDRDYAIQSTEFDIVEQGEVPILMSLP